VEVRLDTPVLLFTLLISLLTGVLFGLAPAASLGQRFGEALQQGGRTTASRGRQGLRAALLVAQVAVSFILLIGAGLMVRSFLKLQHANPGFSPDRVLSLRISPSFSAYPGSQLVILTEKILQRVAAVGAVQSVALTSNPDVYTLSLGHMADLTFSAFAYLRLPLAMAGIATLVGAIGGWFLPFRRAVWALAIMMVLFFQAARVALVVFDPYLSTRPLAEVLNHAPDGQLIVDDQYYSFSSVFFYTGRTALLLNGRVNNLEYGSYRPGAPQVFLKDADLPPLWKSDKRYYLVAENPQMARFQKLLGSDTLHVVASSGGKSLLTNR